MRLLSKIVPDDETILPRTGLSVDRYHGKDCWGDDIEYIHVNNGKIGMLLDVGYMSQWPAGGGPNKWTVRRSDGTWDMGYGFGADYSHSSSGGMCAGPFAGYGAIGPSLSSMVTELEFRNALGQVIDPDSIDRSDTSITVHVARWLGSAGAYGTTTRSLIYTADRTPAIYIADEQGNTIWRNDTIPVANAYGASVKIGGVYHTSRKDILCKVVQYDGPKDGTPSGMQKNVRVYFYVPYGGKVNDGCDLKFYVFPGLRAHLYTPGHPAAQRYANYRLGGAVDKLKAFITAASTEGNPDGWNYVDIASGYFTPGTNLIMLYGQDSTSSGASSGVTVTATDNKVNKGAHGLTNGTGITFTSLTGGAPLATATTYYVVNKTDDAFELSLTVGGGTIDITSDSSGSPAYQLEDSVTIAVDDSLDTTPRNKFYMLDRPLTTHVAVGRLKYTLYRDEQKIDMVQEVVSGGLPLAGGMFGAAPLLMTYNFGGVMPGSFREIAPELRPLGIAGNPNIIRASGYKWRTPDRVELTDNDGSTRVTVTPGATAASNGADTRWYLDTGGVDGSTYAGAWWNYLTTTRHDYVYLKNTDFDLYDSEGLVFYKSSDPSIRTKITCDANGSAYGLRCTLEKIVDRPYYYYDDEFMEEAPAETLSMFNDVVINIRGTNDTAVTSVAPGAALPKVTIDLTDMAKHF